MKRLASLVYCALCAFGACGAADASARSSATRGALAGADTTSGQADIDDAPSIEGSLGRYGDPGGLRAFLSSKGIDYEFTYIGEVLGNATGGIKQGATYEGALDADLDIDLHKLIGLKGAAAHVELLEVNGRGLSGNNLFDAFTVSGIEAYPSTKLYEAWYEQSLVNDRVALRFGQLGADTEFLFSRTASVFVDSTFSWPALLNDDLLSGGPAYPLATPGIRLKLRPIDDLTLLAAVFDDNPAGPYQPGRNAFLPEVRDLHGTAFRVQDAPLLITQASYSYNQSAQSAGLPGQVQFGYFHDFGSAAPMDDPSEQRHGASGFYGVVDQSIYRVPGNEARAAAVFLRLIGTPSQSNAIDFYADAGIAFKGPMAWRPDDTVGLAVAFARASPNATQSVTVDGNGNTVAGSQVLIEATYQIALRPGLTVQPDIQYIFNAGPADLPASQSRGTGNGALVLGLRASVHY